MIFAWETYLAFLSPILRISQIRSHHCSYWPSNMEPTKFRPIPSNIEDIYENATAVQTRHKQAHQHAPLHAHLIRLQPSL